MKRSTRDLLICISLTNFALLGEWRLLLDCKWYWAAIRPSHFLAVMVTSALLTAVLWCGSRIARRSGNRIQFVAKWFFFQIFVFSIFNLWMYYNKTAITASVIAMLAVVPLLLAASPRFHRWAAMLLLIFFPCTIFLVLRSAWDASRVPPAIVVRGSLAPSSAQDQRVLLLVFDEMSEYVAFDHRPAGVNMPAFDRLRREAFVGSAAYPPGNATIESMPALLTGRPLYEVDGVSGHELRITYLLTYNSESLADAKTMFSDAHALGLKTSMIGWYHPYCSVLSDLDYCAHFKTGVAVSGIQQRGGLVAKMLDLMAQAGPVVDHTRLARWRRHRAYVESLQLETSQLETLVQNNLANFRSGVAVIHLPMPHPPAINAQGLYFANLVAADQELAAIRKIMEDAGTWDGTTVLVTSDHNWRTHGWEFMPVGTEAENAYIDSDSDKRVPFIVKLPGKNTPAVYTPEFNTLLTRSMIQAILTGQIRTPDALTQWLDLHRKDIPSIAYRLVHTRH